MARVLQGEVSDGLTVSDDLTIQGNLSGDTLVVGGGHLLVQGAVTGRVEVQRDGSLHVQGTGGFPLANHGLVILGGTFDQDWLDDAAAGDGTIVVWPGSLITRRVGPPFLVNADGTHSVVDDSSGINTTINADPAAGFLLYRDNTFTAVPAPTIRGLPR